MGAVYLEMKNYENDPTLYEKFLPMKGKQQLKNTNKGWECSGGYSSSICEDQGQLPAP